MIATSPRFSPCNRASLIGLWIVGGMLLSIIGVEGGLSMPSFGGAFGRSGGSLEGHGFAGALGGAVLIVGAMACRTQKERA